MRQCDGECIFRYPFCRGAFPAIPFKDKDEALQISNPKRLLDVHFYPLRFILPDRKSFRLHAGSVGLADGGSRLVKDLEALGRQAEQPFRHFAGAVICFQRAVQAADLLLRQGVKDKIVPFVF
mgnify:FL=1